MRSYIILGLLSSFCFALLPSVITFNWYYSAYFISMTIYRIYPELFNHTKRSAFVAADYKCHLFAGLFGYLLGLFMILNGYANCTMIGCICNSMPFCTILMSDGYFGQYKAHRR